MQHPHYDALTRISNTKQPSAYEKSGLDCKTVTAKVFPNGRSQAIRLPKKGSSDILFNALDGFTDDFMETRDLLIAAHAKALDLRLVTNNLREFSRVPGLEVADWS